MPTIPAAAIVCPRFAFAPPAITTWSAVLKNAKSAPVSVGSPSLVPVPCSSTDDSDASAFAAESSKA